MIKTKFKELILNEFEKELKKRSILKKYNDFVGNIIRTKKYVSYADGLESSTKGSIKYFIENDFICEKYSSFTNDKTNIYENINNYEFTKENAKLLVKNSLFNTFRYYELLNKEEGVFTEEWPGSRHYIQFFNRDLDEENYSKDSEFWKMSIPEKIELFLNKSKNK
jgi:hypothetical protein